jgi:hypothetical protein
MGVLHKYAPVRSFISRWGRIQVCRGDDFVAFGIRIITKIIDNL